MTLELVDEWGDISSTTVKDRRPVERVQPLRTGDKAPFFSIANRAGYWTTPVLPSTPAEHILTLPHLLEAGTLVVGFYCPCWGRYAEPFLDTLIRLAEGVHAHGAQLVVFSNEHPRYMPNKAQEAPMTIVFDADKSVAQQFGVYSEADPIWDRISGISEEVYIPALYVVDAGRQIRYQFLDENFESLTHQAQPVIEAITHTIVS